MRSSSFARRAALASRSSFICAYLSARAFVISDFFFLAAASDAALAAMVFYSRGEVRGGGDINIFSGGFSVWREVDNYCPGAKTGVGILTRVLCTGVRGVNSYNSFL